MDPEEDFNRFRFRSKVQIVAVIDILVGTIPFINLAFDFNNKDLADLYPEREMLVLLWTVLLCVYVLQLIIGVFLLAATREVYTPYTIGNCQVWYHVALFSFVFYTGEMIYDISSIVNGPSNNRSIKQVFVTMSYHAVKIIYRAYSLMIVNNFLYDICRPVSLFLNQGSYQYKYYYHTHLGLPLPSRRASVAVPNVQIQANPTYSVYSTYPQPRSKVLMVNNNSHPLPPRPQRHPNSRRPPYNHPRTNFQFQHNDGMAIRLQ